MAHWFKLGITAVCAVCVLLAFERFFHYLMWYRVKILGPFGPIWFEKSSLSLGWISMPGYKVMMSLCCCCWLGGFISPFQQLLTTILQDFLNQTYAAHGRRPPVLLCIRRQVKTNSATSLDIIFKTSGIYRNSTATVRAAGVAVLFIIYAKRQKWASRTTFNYNRQQNNNNRLMKSNFKK